MTPDRTRSSNQTVKLLVKPKNKRSQVNTPTPASCDWSINLSLNYLHRKPLEQVWYKNPAVTAVYLAPHNSDCTLHILPRGEENQDEAEEMWREGKPHTGSPSTQIRSSFIAFCLKGQALSQPGDRDSTRLLNYPKMSSVILVTNQQLRDRITRLPFVNM